MHCTHRGSDAGEGGVIGPHFRKRDEEKFADTSGSFPSSSIWRATSVAARVAARRGEAVAAPTFPRASRLGVS